MFIEACVTVTTVAPSSTIAGTTSGATTVATTTAPVSCFYELKRKDIEENGKTFADAAISIDTTANVANLILQDQPRYISTVTLQSVIEQKVTVKAIDENGDETSEEVR